MNLCTICHQPVSTDEAGSLLKRAHVECALEASRERIAESSARDQRLEARETTSKLEAARFAARRNERLRIVEWLRKHADALGWEAQQMALGLATAIEEGAHTREEP